MCVVFLLCGVCCYVMMAVVVCVCDWVLLFVSLLFYVYVVGCCLCVDCWLLFVFCWLCVVVCGCVFDVVVIVCMWLLFVCVDCLFAFCCLCFVDVLYEGGCWLCALVVVCGLLLLV